MNKPVTNPMIKSLCNKAVSYYNIPIPQLSKVLQIKYSTLYKWINKYKEENDIPIKQSHPQKLKDQAIKMNSEEGMTSVQIAEKLEVPRGTIFDWIRQHKMEHNIPVQTRQSYSQKQRDKVIKMVIKKGITQRQAARMLNVSEDKISSWVRQHRREHNIPKQRRSYSQEEIDKAIKMIIEEGMTEKQTAQKLKIPQGTISQWAHRYKKEHDLEIRTKQASPK